MTQAVFHAQDQQGSFKSLSITWQSKFGGVQPKFGGSQPKFGGLQPFKGVMLLLEGDFPPAEPHQDGDPLPTPQIAPSFTGRRFPVIIQ